MHIKDKVKDIYVAIAYNVRFGAGKCAVSGQFHHIEIWSQTNALCEKDYLSYVNVWRQYLKLLINIRQSQEVGE